jgi:hypothetical protein
LGSAMQILPNVLTCSFGVVNMNANSLHLFAGRFRNSDTIVSCAITRCTWRCTWWTRRGLQNPICNVPRRVKSLTADVELNAFRSTCGLYDLVNLLFRKAYT